MMPTTIAVLIVAGCAWLGVLRLRQPRPLFYRGVHRTARVWLGATVEWSPKRDSDDAGAGLTPLGLLEREPVALDDGTVVGTSSTPRWAVIHTDAHHVLDGGPIDEARARLARVVSDVQAELLRPREIRWASIHDTVQWEVR